MASEAEFDFKAPADAQQGIVLTVASQDEYLQPRFGLIHTSSWFSTADWAMGLMWGFCLYARGSCLFPTDRPLVKETNMANRRIVSVTGLISLFILLNCRPLAAKEMERRVEWLPIVHEDLALKDNPANPGASAMILYEETWEDDVNSYETHYNRIKVFTDEGKQYADVEITYLAGRNEVVEILGRTIHPDGSVVDFQGQILEKTVVSARKLKYQAKVFTLPDVQKGSIIEYSYKVRWRSKAPDALVHPGEYIFTQGGFLAATKWEIQGYLFTRCAHFYIRPIRGARLTWTGRGLPGTNLPQTLNDGSIEYTAENVPALQKEEYMPPEDMLRSRLDVYYIYGFQISPEQYWRQEGHWRAEAMEKFIGKSKNIDRLVAELINENDQPQIKLRKLYDRAQQIRFLSYEPSKTEKEEKKENIKENKNVDDVLKHGYASGNEVNLFYIALARAAGFQAAPVLVRDRRYDMFQRESLDSTQLDAMVVWLRVGSTDVYVDPASRYCPFNSLPWYETQASGIRISNSGIEFITTPQPPSTDAVIERRATLEMDPEGGLQGNVHVTFTGQEALERRVENGEKDDAGRKKELEDELKAWLPPGSMAELKASSDWKQSGESFDADFNVKISNVAIRTGRRFLLPPAVFHTQEKSPFQTAQRVNPVYFRYPYQEGDDITIKLPSGFQVENLPLPKEQAKPFGQYSVSYQTQQGAIRCVRRMVREGMFFQTNNYPNLRDFYDAARAGDGQQAVLKAVEAAQHE